MAEIVLGMGTSHSPMLSMSAEMWPEYAKGDVRIRDLLTVPDGRNTTFDELLKTAPPDYAQQLTPQTFAAQWADCQRGIQELEQTLKDVRPDTLIIFGDDQDEIFFDDNMPSVAVYWGETMKIIPRNPPPTAPPAIRASAWGYGDKEKDFPVDVPLARHLIDYLIEHDFDVAHWRYMRDEYGGTIGPAGYVDHERVTQPRRFGMPHAYSFVVRRIMNGNEMPIVPIMLNTCYPPNQPTPRRCYQLGRAVRNAVEEWGDGRRVAVIGSGGLSHFVVDDDLDRMVLKAMEEKDADTLMNVPRQRLNSATSEIRNWVAAAGAAEHLRCEVLAYAPVRRTPAGTGGGWAFARWM